MARPTQHAAKSHGRATAEVAPQTPKALRLPPDPAVATGVTARRAAAGRTGGASGAKIVTVTPLPKTGGSSKFRVVLEKRGEFTIALSRTLCLLVWQLETPEAELAAAQQMADALVGRHDPSLPFKEIYIFAEHNSQPTLDAMLKYLRKNQL